MAYSGPVRSKASVRVVQTAIAADFVAGTNSGLFAAITFIANGDHTIDLDPDLLPGPILEQDTFDASIEGVLEGLIVIERVSATQIRVRTFDTFPALAFRDYSLDMNTVFFG